MMRFKFGWLLLAGALAVSGCNKGEEGGSGSSSGNGDTTGSLKIAMMPKTVGNDYFSAVESGAKEAAEEIGAELIYDGPVNDDAAKQTEMLDTWITQGVDVIAISPNDPQSLAPTLEKARQRGIEVITFDSDSLEESRSYFVNQATAQAIGHALVDEMAEQIGGAGEVAIVMGSMTADNQNQWIHHMRERIAEKFPQMNVVDVKPSDEDQQKATQITQDLLKAYPNIKGVFGITSVAFPGAALAVKQSGAAGRVAVVGLATPKGMLQYVNDDTVKTVILWSPKDLGYLTVFTAKALKEDGKLGETVSAGRLGDKVVSGTQVLLGEPMKFNKDNIAEYDF